MERANRVVVLFFNGRVTPAVRKIALITNWRIGLRVSGFESLLSHNLPEMVDGACE